MLETRSRRTLAALTLGAIVLAACAGAERGPTAPRPLADLTAEERASCDARARSLIARPVWVSLVGVDPSVRARLGASVTQGRTVGVRLEARDCDVAVEVLSCSRRVAFRTRQATAPSERETIARRDLGSTSVAGAATLLAKNEGRAVRVQRTVAGTRAVSWYAPPRGEELPLPPLDAVELAGDCARATHYVTAVDDGAFIVIGQDARGEWSSPLDESACKPGRCAEPIAVALQPPLRAGCPVGAPGCPWPPLDDTHPRSYVDADRSPPKNPYAACPPPIAGQMTEQLAQAVRLMRGEKWGDAALAFYRVGRGETGDDAGNVQIAIFEGGAAALHAHDWIVGRDLLQLTASMPCGLRAPEAAAWLAALQRRAATPP